VTPWLLDLVACAAPLRETDIPEIRIARRAKRALSINYTYRPAYRSRVIAVRAIGFEKKENRRGRSGRSERSERSK